MFQIGSLGREGRQSAHRGSRSSSVTCLAVSIPSKPECIPFVQVWGVLFELLRFSLNIQVTFKAALDYRVVNRRTQLSRFRTSLTILFIYMRLLSCSIWLPRDYHAFSRGVKHSIQEFLINEHKGGIILSDPHKPRFRLYPSCHWSG